MNHNRRHLASVDSLIKKGLQQHVDEWIADQLAKGRMTYDPTTGVYSKTVAGGQP